MATAKPPPLPKAPKLPQHAPRRRRWRNALVVVLLAMVFLLAWFWQPLNGYAQVGAAYGARVACSCRHLGGRGLGDCRKDFVPYMALVTLSENAKAKSVTARYALFSSQTAQFREGEGCVLEKWED